MSALLFSLVLACGPKGGPLSGMPPLGPSPHAISAPAAGIAPDWAGTWGADDTSAVFRFTIDHSTLWMDAWDTGDGEWFRLEALEYAGDVRVRSTMPSTDWTLDNTFSLQGKESILHHYEGMANGDSPMYRVTAEAPAP